jgi:small subunit ribosomal protein S1
MDQRMNQAADTPAPATDPAPETNQDETPTAVAEQGDQNASAEATPEDQASVATISEKADDEITMEDVLAASDEQLARKPVHRGMIVNGQVIMLTQDGIVVDVGAKIEGLLPYNQIFEHDSNAEEASQYIKSGDPITVYVVRSDVPNNTIVLSKRRADAERAWNLLQEIHEKEKPVEVEIVEKVRGGLVANLGVRAFLPASQVDVRRVNDLSPYVGLRMKVKIIELNRRRNRVIISRRAILEVELAGQKEETLKKLEPGFKTEGEVVEITDFGVFVNLGGIDGLVHRSELTHGRFNHPRDVLKVGEKVKVEVLDMDLERERINLSMKKLMPNPWENVLANYSIGQRIGGKVTNLTPFGAFVEIEPGLEGLIHVSEMSWTKRVRHPKEIVTEGDDVEAMILKIDTQQERISLGLRQTQPDPWSSLPDRYPPGTEVTGPITGLTDFGVFMEIEEGIEGLVHISELAHEHIEDVNEHFKRGDEITAVILNIDPVEQRASLSRKRLLPFTAGTGGFDEIGTGAPSARGGPAGARRGGRRGGRRGAGIDYDYSYAAESAGQKTTTKLGDVYADLFAQFGLTADVKDDTREAAQPEAERPAAGAQASGPEQGVEPAAEGVQPATGADATTPTADAPAEGSHDEGEAALARPVVPGAEPEAPEAEAHAPASYPAEEAPGQQAADSESSGVVSERAEAVRHEFDAAPPTEPVAEPTTMPGSSSGDPELGDADTAIDAAEAAALLTAAFREGRRPLRPSDETTSIETASQPPAPAEPVSEAPAHGTASEPTADRGGAEQHDAGSDQRRHDDPDEHGDAEADERRDAEARADGDDGGRFDDDDDERAGSTEGDFQRDRDA